MMTTPDGWLFLPEVWIILGLLMIGLEVLLDGSKAVFLPLGLAGLLNGGLVYLYTPDDNSLINSWDDTLVSFAIFAIISAIALRYYVQRRKTDDTADINEY